MFIWEGKMAAKKIYAVKKGRKSGIFDSWEECKSQVEGYSDAIYKSFSSLEDAKKYLEDNTPNIVVPKKKTVKKKELSSTKDSSLKPEKNSVIAYIDGSYSEQAKKYSFGCVIIADEIIELMGTGDNPEAVGMRNVAGELLGAMRAIKWAHDNKYEKITLYHDYEGISKWAKGQWKAKQDSTKKYIEFLNKYKSLLKIEFVKVLAHSGVKYNEEADKLAKKALEEKPELNKNLVKNEPDNTNLTLFSEIMKVKEKTKNKCIIKLKEYEVSESKLQKFVKEFWKQKGNDGKQIDLLTIYVDPYSNIVNWEIKDKSGNSYKFELIIQ